MIADSSTLIIFSRINKLELLANLFGDIIITESVYNECCIEGLKINAPDALLIKTWVDQSRITVTRLPDMASATRLQRLYPQLGNGEAEAIAFALQEKEETILLDDRLARRVARLYGLKPIGTLHVILRLYKNRTIQKQKHDVRAIMNCLRNINFASVVKC